jgi:hypothetical protein
LIPDHGGIDSRQGFAVVTVGVSGGFGVILGLYRGTIDTVGYPRSDQYFVAVTVRFLENNRKIGKTSRVLRTSYSILWVISETKKNKK